MRKIGLITVLLLMVLLILAGCGDQDQTSQTTTDPKSIVDTNSTMDTPAEQKSDVDQPDSATVVPEATTDESEEQLTEVELAVANEENNDQEADQKVTEAPEMPRLENGPYLGKLVEKIDLPRPVMVMIENSPAARPQRGLDQASIVYEFLVEGGITRFLALFYETFPAKVGPVRSTRPYFIQTALEYDAVLLHVGASAEGFSLLETSGIDHVDQINNGMYYLRNNSRRAPHNVYTGKSMLESYWKDQPTTEVVEARFPYQIIGLVNQTTVQEAYEIKIRYWGGYTVGYKYNETNGKYLRFIDGLPHLLEGGKKLYADNIFVQYVDTNVKDDEGRLDMQNVGTGKALLFKDGFVYEGTWSKEEGEKTYFLDDQGEEFQINPGQTWIQVVPLSVKVEY